MAENLQTPRGTKDILPEEQKYWEFLRNAFSKQAETFGCGKIETPVYEYAQVFTRTLGEDSDIVTKEMFEVKRAKTIDAMEENDEPKTMVLRPEMTAAVARAYIQHGMKTWPQPVKLFYDGPLFRYERPQAGRFRIHHQLGVEVFGDAEPLADASLIYLAYQTFKKVGLEKNIKIDINSIGDAACRPKMKKKLREYFEKFLPTLCADCNRRYIDNPLRIFDCKEEKCQRVVAGAPQLVDMLCSDCRAHFKAVLENLDTMQIPYNLNPKLVRGLDYYTRTVFEFYDENDPSRQGTMLGGGRYDGLIKLMGGGDVPGIGFGAGMERIIEKIKEYNVEIPQIRKIDVCIAQIGEKAQKKCLPLVSELEEIGIDATCILGKESLKGQLRMASRLKAKIALIIGQREVLDKTVIIRIMDDGVQETVKMTDLIEVLKEKLGK